MRGHIFVTISFTITMGSQTKTKFLILAILIHTDFKNQLFYALVDILSESEFHFKSQFFLVSNL